MVRSLFFKLVGAFALVILVLAAVVTLLAKQATAEQFRAYTDRSGQLWAQQLAPALSDYYSSTGTWPGVSGALEDPMNRSGESGTSSAAVNSLTTGSPTPVPSAALQADLATDRTGPGKIDSPPAPPASQPAGSAVGASPSPSASATPPQRAGAPDMMRGRMGPGRAGSGMMGAGSNSGTQGVPGLGMQSSAAQMPDPIMPQALGTTVANTQAEASALVSGSPEQKGSGEGTGTTPGPASRGGIGASAWRGMMMGRAVRDSSQSAAQGAGNQSLVDMWTMMGQRVIVADTSGQVVSDSAGSLQDKALSSQQLETGAPIQVAGQPAGTVLVTSGEVTPASLAGQFLAAVNRSILVAALAAGALSMGLGGLLFFQITAPLRRLKAAAVAIAAGDLTQRVSVRSHDELGDLAQTFNTMAESLALVEAERRHMVADVAHELRTPLSVMQANLEAMQDGVLPLDAEQIASLHEETVLLSRLVADLRLLSLAEAGQLKMERAEMNPDDLIRKAAERLYPKAEELGVTLTVEAVAPLPAVSVDSDRISQVVGNLVSNALRYTPAGGTVTVQVKPEVNHRSSASRQEIPAVLVSVTDTGTGIPEADLPHIFDRFYRADKSRTRASGGSGLGLSIVKHLVEAHGGRVWVESPVLHTAQGRGYGTRVSFTLPALETMNAR